MRDPLLDVGSIFAKKGGIPMDKYLHFKPNKVQIVALLQVWLVLQEKRDNMEWRPGIL